MKKIFTLAMALCFVFGAFAASVRPYAAKAQATSFQKENRMAQLKSMPELKENVNLQAMIDNSPIKAHKTPTQLVPNKARKVANGTTTDLVIKEGYALFLGTYYYYVYGSYSNEWELDLTSKNGEDIVLYFNSPSDTRIVGYYRDAMATFIMEGDTIDTEGELDIAFKSAGSSAKSPTYTFNGTFTDDKGNTYNVTGEYAFSNDSEDPGVLDLLYYMFCYYYEEGCDEMAITLTDKAEPAMADTTTITISTNMTKFYDEARGTWSVSAEDETYYNATEFFTNDFATIVGEYTKKEMYPGSTYLIQLGKKKDTQIELYSPLSMKVEAKADTLLFTETVLGIDGKVYVINMQYVEPVATDTIELVTDGNFEEYADYGVAMGYGVSEEKSGKTYLVSFAVYTDVFAGEYTTKNLYGGGSSNYVAVMTKKDTTYYAIIKDTMTVLAATSDESAYIDYMAYITALAVNDDDPADAIEFKITVALASYYKYDSNRDVTVIYNEGTDNIQVIDDYFDEEGSVYIYVENAAKTDVFYAVVFPDFIDPVYTMPFNEYPVETSGYAPSFYASSGYSALHGPTPSYYATIKDEMLSEIWFITGGSFYKEAGVMTLLGTNSNGKNVTVIINTPSTDLRNTNADAEIKANKIIQNGQIVILKNGKLYNALGAEIVK